jgi:hypothetical protein
MTDDKPDQRWFIDLDWLEQHNRSFPALAQGCLCSKCTKKQKGGAEPISPAELISSIEDCCAKSSGFITDKLPILDSIFRLFLANGNKPLSLQEMSKQLAKWRGDDSPRTSVEILSRLLRDERYYGLRPAP